MSPVRNACLLGVQKIMAHAYCPLLAKETVLGPMSLKERGDRRRPRIANLVQFPVTSNCSIASKRLHALTHSLTFVPAYTKSRSVGPLAVARLTQGISPKNCKLARASG